MSTPHDQHKSHEPNELQEPHETQCHVPAKGVWGHVWRFFLWLTPMFLRRCKVLTLVFVVAMPLAACGGVLFRESVFWANFVREEFPWLIAFLPLAGLLIVWLYRRNQVGLRDEIGVLIHAFETSNSAQPSTVPRRMAVTVFVAGVLTHLFGGSAGCEGASLLIGGGIGARLAQHFHLHREEYRLVVFCAMASAFAPLLGTPIAAAFFVLERCPAGKLSFFLPCLFASFGAFGLSLLMNVQPMRFALEPLEFEPVLLGKLLVLAVLCFGLSLLFRFLLRYVTRQCIVRFQNASVPIFFGALILIAAVSLLGTQAYCGTSFPGIDSALLGRAATWGFLWKLLLTVLTLGVGFKGGQIVPAFFVGATFGVIAGGWLGLELGFAAAFGLIVVFAGVVRCPITAVILSQELFFHADPLCFLLGVLVCVAGMGIVTYLKSLRFANSVR